MAVPEWLKSAVDAVTGDTASKIEAKKKADQERMDAAGIPRPKPRTSRQSDNEKLKNNMTNR